MERKDIGTAVVGCGNWGVNHVRILNKYSRLRYCCDQDSERLKEVEKRFPSVNTTGRLGDVLKDSNVKGVVIATPAVTHAELAVRALRAGKHVLVEKPLALESEAAERVRRTASRCDRVLMVGHIMEYHPAVEKMRELLGNGDLGEPYYLYSQRVNLGTVRRDENALWSLAPHDVSMMNWLIGEEPAEVRAHGGAYLRSNIEDVAFLYLRYPNGVVGHVHVSWLDPHKERKMTVVGGDKMVVFDDMSSEEKVKIYDKGAEMPKERVDATTASQVYLRDGDIVIPAVDGDEPLLRELTDFLECIESGITPRADGPDGVGVVRVLERAQRALEREKNMMAPDGTSG